MPSYVVAGASRGIGYALASNLAAKSENTVIGLVRSVDTAKAKFAKDFPGNNNIHIIHGDLTDYKSVEAAAKETAALTGGSLDVLIVNAGIGKVDYRPPVEEVTSDPEAFEHEMLADFRTNALGATFTLAFFAPLLEKGTLKKAAVISAPMGDIGVVRDWGLVSETAYSISKAALNMAVAKFHVQYRDQGILFTAITPGIVETERTPEAEAGLKELFGRLAVVFKEKVPSWDGRRLKPDESAALMLDVLHKATVERNGGIMVSHHGNQVWL